MHNIHSSGNSWNHESTSKGKAEDKSGEHFFQDPAHVVEFWASENESDDEEDHAKTHGDVWGDVMVEIPCGIAVTVGEEGYSIVCGKCAT